MQSMISRVLSDMMVTIIEEFDVKDQNLPDETYRDKNFSKSAQNSTHLAATQRI